jgi:hypothetical protein
LETLRQGKKTTEELNTEFLQIVGQAGMDRKTPSDHLHLIGYYRKVLEPRLSCKIFFSNDVPKMIDRWMEKAIQFDMNWRMDSLFFNQDINVTTLILNEYRQSSSSSVLAFKFKVLRLLRMPIARYCLSVKLVRVRSKVDS